VSSLLDLCCSEVAASVPDLSSLGDTLPRELMARLTREARLCAGCAGPYYGSGFARRLYPHRLAEQDVVLESVYCSPRCAADARPPPLTASHKRQRVAKGSESMEDLAATTT
jgi:hypothetical protein